MRGEAMRSVIEKMKKATVAGFSLTFAMCVVASDGRIPIGTTPYTISSSGSYYLTADLVNATTSPAVTIAASNVSLDLNGHYIWEQSASAFYTIYCNGYTNIKVFNGMIRASGYGVYFTGVPGGVIRVDGLTITGHTYSAIYVAGGSPQPAIRVTNNTISAVGISGGPGGIGAISVTGGEISHNQIVGGGIGTSGGIGIGANPGTSLLIKENSLTSCYLAVYISGTNIEARDNLITNSSVGLEFNSVTNCVYRNNTAQGNTANYSIPGAGVTNAGGNF